MLIGLLSDSHSNAARLRNAVALLIGRGAEALVHCGDIEAAGHVSILSGAGLPAYLAAGNMDRNAAVLAREAGRCGVNFAADFIEAPIGDGEHLVALHGDNEHLLCELVEGGQFPYVIHGHTHRTSDIKYGSTRVICPGALAHPRKPKHPTAALLDTEADTVEFLKIL